MLDDKVFNKLREIIYESAGIRLNDTKKALVSSRVAKRLRALNMDDYKEYLEFLQSGKSETEMVELLDVISTNFTHFFREQEHFDLMAKYLKENWSAGKRRFRIWSCASSTGEEPYSLALTIADTLPKQADIKILATDISTKVLGQCKKAYYSKEKLKTVPAALKQDYFIPTESPDILQVKQELKNMISFCRLNLSTPPFPMQGPFEIIFCRNVMIYFDTPVRQRLISEIERLLLPGGLFMVGHSESLTGIKHNLRTLAPSIYQKG